MVSEHCLLRFPGLGEFADRRVAFAIDGELHQDAWFSAIGADSEVYLVPIMGGDCCQAPQKAAPKADFTTPPPPVPVPTSRGEC